MYFLSNFGVTYIGVLTCIYLMYLFGPELWFWYIPIKKGLWDCYWSRSGVGVKKLRNENLCEGKAVTNFAESCNHPNRYILEHFGFSSSSCAITSAIAIRSASRGSEGTLALSSLMVFTICSAFCSVVGRNTGTGTWKHQNELEINRVGLSIYLSNKIFVLLI